LKIATRLKWLLLTPLGLVVSVTILAPLVVVAFYSLYQFVYFSIYGSASFANYNAIFTAPLYRDTAVITIAIAGPTTILTCLLGYLLAYAMTFGNPRWRLPLFALVLSSLMASYLARIYAWRTLLGPYGLINTMLEGSGLIHSPIQALLFTRWSAVLAEVNLLTPFAGLTFFAALSGISPELPQAARDLGASSRQALRRVVLPLTGPAVLATGTVVFFLSCGDYITPIIVGGTNSQTIGVIISTAFGSTGQYGLGGAISLVVLAAFACAYLGTRQVLRWTRVLPTAAASLE
jgi:spermidine/putrescine transport system permease protein